MKSLGGSVLFAALKGDIINAAAGLTPGELSYMYYIADNNMFSEVDTLSVCSVELPFRSGVHIVGQPLVGPLVFIDVSQLDYVRLEGDYSEYFALYAEPTQGSGTHYVLDPAAMVFTIDFCSQYHWEIIDDMLYFITTGIAPSLELVDEFVRQIRPAVEIESDRGRNAAKLPHVHTFGRVVKCPHCSERLAIGRSWMECPRGHGFLITGKQLKEERESSEVINYTPEVAAKSIVGTGIMCPYCNNPTNAIPYQNGNVVIDVCSKCPHRWIDGGEIESIIG